MVINPLIRAKDAKSMKTPTLIVAAILSAVAGMPLTASITTAQVATQSISPQDYNMKQTLSDQAQLMTIAFEGLAFMTAGFGADTFMPPGKIGDYFGFQYMRDIDSAGMGHNPKFLDRIAANVLSILGADQKALFLAEANNEALQLSAIAVRRFTMISAFIRQLNQQIPTGSKGLSNAAVTNYDGDSFVNETTVAYQRAAVYGKIVSTLTTSQKADLAKLQFGNFNSWPDLSMKDYMLPPGTASLVNVAYMTLASEFFSWYAGSVTADTYFCPERHGTYFGGFFLKDAPAMGQKDYNIPTDLTGKFGAAFLDGLNAVQRSTMTAILQSQRATLYKTVAVRRAISMELRKFLKGGTPSQTTLLALGRQYGVLDGHLAYLYSTAYAKIFKTLSSDQKAAFLKLRLSLGNYTPAAAYIFADALTAIPSYTDGAVLFVSSK